MRMWMLNPVLLCDKHLLGEHVETHMIAGCLIRGKSLDGYVRKGLIETRKLEERHGELAEEMAKRGMNHRSPLPEFEPGDLGRVNLATSLADLTGRCEDCRARYLVHAQIALAPLYAKIAALNNKKRK